jgi:hypothetical protein
MRGEDGRVRRRTIREQNLRREDGKVREREDNDKSKWGRTAML